MAKKNTLQKLLSFVAWLTGVIVSLAVGFAMTGEVLTVPYLPAIVSVVAGWIVVITTLITLVLVMVNSFS